MSTPSSAHISEASEIVSQYRHCFRVDALADILALDIADALSSAEERGRIAGRQEAAEIARQTGKGLAPSSFPSWDKGYHSASERIVAVILAETPAPEDPR